MFKNILKELDRLKKQQSIIVPIAADVEGYYDKECPAEICLFNFEVLGEDQAVIADLRSERDRLLKILEEHAGTVKLLTDERQKTQQPARRWWRDWR